MKYSIVTALPAIFLCDDCLSTNPQPRYCMYGVVWSSWDLLGWRLAAGARAGAGWRGPGVVECETEQRPVLSAAAAPLQLVGYYNAVVQIYKVRMIDGDRFKPMFRFCPSFRDETMNLLVTVISSCVRVSSAGARTLELTCVWLW